MVIEIISMSPEEFRIGHERFLMGLPRVRINKTKSLVGENNMTNITKDVTNQHYDDYINKLIKEGKARVISH